MALTLRTAVGRTTPLSNIELDGNFTYLETQSNLRLVITDYNYSTILERLNGAPSQYRGSGSNLDVRYLQGNEPNSVLPAGTNKQSVVLRDGTGNFSANIITANLTGKSTTSGTADQSIKLQTARNINTVAFDGTADITIYDKTKLPVNTVVSAGSFTVGVTYLILTLGTTDWVAIGASSASIGVIFVANGPGTGSGTANVVMISKLITKASTTTNANFNIPAGAAPSEPINGDIWSSTTTGTLFNRTNSVTREFAYLDSTITGNAANVTGIVAIAHGGTGKANIADARVALDVAKRGDNSDITSITGLTTALSTGQGGTGLQSSGANRNILISNGTVWASEKPSGTWDINISGEAATSVKHVVSDTASVTTTPATFATPGVVFQLKRNDKETLDDGGTYFGEMTFRKAGNDTDFTKGKVFQLGFTDNTNLHIRSGTSAWGDWYKFLNSNNYNDYAPKKDGTGASGSWSINITGSANSASTAGSAAALTTARNINGVSFNGTANITIADDTKLPIAGGTMTGRLVQSSTGFLGNYKDSIKTRVDSGFWQTGHSIIENGWPVGTIGNPGSWYHLLTSTHTNDSNYHSMQLAADFFTQNLYYRSTNNDGLTAWNKILHSTNYNDYAPKKDGTGATGTWSINISGNAATSSSTSGNAATATKLATARKINGVSFDGSADITVADDTKLPLVGGTLTGKLGVKHGADKGIHFPLDAYGGSGDTARITLEALSGEATRMRFTITNDADDVAEFMLPSTDNLLVNNNIVLNAANYNNYSPSKTGTGASGKWSINISGNADTATSASANDVYAWAKAATKPSYTKADVGLSNADNTSDADKNVKSAKTVEATVTGTNTADLITATMATNDAFRLRVGGTEVDGGWVELATFDNGNEPIYVRQYASAGDNNSVRTATILGTDGNTSFPGTVTANTFSGAGTSLTGTASNLNIGGTAAKATILATARKINGVDFDGSKDITVSIPAALPASDVYAWAKASTKPSYAYSEITGSKPTYAWNELTGTVPTFNQNTTGTAANGTKWDGATKYVQSTQPVGVDGDIWFKV